MAPGLARNLAAYARFLETTTFSHGQILNISAVAADTHIQQKLAESYFEILEDLLLCRRLPVFQRRAKRKLTVRPKFFLFDAGLFQTLRPHGPLDSEPEIGGAAFEGLILQADCFQQNKGRTCAKSSCGHPTCWIRSDEYAV